MTETIKCKHPHHHPGEVCIHCGRRVPHRRKWGDPGSKTVRKTEGTVYSQGRYRRIVTAIHPSGLIAMRLEGERRWFYGQTRDIYRRLVWAERRGLVAAAAAKRKTKRVGRV